MIGGGKDEEICAQISAREATGQLQAASPAADSCSERGKQDKDVQEGAAGGAAARGRQEQRDSGAKALLRGARQLQGSATAAAAAAGGDTGHTREEEVVNATGNDEERAEQWRGGRAAIAALRSAGQLQQGAAIGECLGELQRAGGPGGTGSRVRGSETVGGGGAAWGGARAGGDWQLGSYELQTPKGQLHSSMVAAG
jgi:hypothetical protein